jgi:hypothetical protein
LNLFESASVGDLLGTGTPDVVKYELSIGQAANLLLVGQNFPYNHLIAAYDGTSGASLPAWPTITDDYQLLSASDIAKIDPTTSDNQALVGTGLGLLHAYDGLTARDVTGFPKVTGGWLFAPAALSNDGRLADITREGYLFEWHTSAPANQPEWPMFRHDLEDTGNYNFDGTPPAAVSALTLTIMSATQARVSFTAPGANGASSIPAGYVVRVNGRQMGGLRAPVIHGRRVSAVISLPAAARTVSIEARNSSGVLGHPASVALPSR